MSEILIMKYFFCEKHIIYICKYLIDLVVILLYILPQSILLSIMEHILNKRCQFLAREIVEKNGQHQKLHSLNAELAQVTESKHNGYIRKN